MKKNDIRVRAIALTNENKLLLIKRVRENVEPYWVFIGGGVEATDNSFESAIKREMIEESNATCDILRPVYLIQREKEDIKQYEIYFLAKIHSWSSQNRTGEEILDIKNGLYLLEEIPINGNILKYNILPEEVKHFINDNQNDIQNIASVDISFL